MPHQPQYRDKEWLVQQYCDQRREVKKIASECGVDRTTIYNWLEKHGIERDRGAGYRTDTPEPYRDREWLRSKYWDEELSTREIASVCDCSNTCIRRWMETHEIPTRGASQSARIRSERHPHSIPTTRHTVNHASVFTRRRGYVYATDSTRQVSIHRLLATLKVDMLGELDGMHIHHKNNIPWDNRLENLEILTPEEHSSLHANE